ELHQDPLGRPSAGRGASARRRRGGAIRLAARRARPRHRVRLPGSRDGPADVDLAELLPRGGADEGLRAGAAVRRRAGAGDRPRRAPPDGHRHPRPGSAGRDALRRRTPVRRDRPRSPLRRSRADPRRADLRARSQAGGRRPALRAAGARARRRRDLHHAQPAPRVPRRRPLRDPQPRPEPRQLHEGRARSAGTCQADGRWAGASGAAARAGGADGGGRAMTTVRLTAAQALVRFLAAQHVERDGVERRFFGGCFGIFGHGNVAGIGEALYENPELLTYYQARNEQAMVHTAVGYARQLNRLGALVCTTSIGPGATNMVTGAALATVNRLPVLLVPGDVFASRRPDPVLQQLEVPGAGDVSVNDCFRPVSRYFDRIWRPEQVIPAALSAMRVLVDQAETGAVTLAFPQDVQAEAYDYPASFFERRVWHVARSAPDEASLTTAVELIRASRRPLIVAGGGVVYAEATEALRAFCEQTGVPVGETQAGKGSLTSDHPSSLGALGVTGTFAANRVAADADLVIGLGTRWSDFTTASKTAFRSPAAR